MPLAPSLVRGLRCPHLRRALAARRASSPTAGPRCDWLPLYAPHERFPTTPVAAAGPWLVDGRGGVTYDAGGYGANAFGHNDPTLLRAVAAPRVQANFLMPSHAQVDVAAALHPHLGSRTIACLNSGSEANSLALRVAARHVRRRPVAVALEGGFHGRTEGPALVSHSSHEAYARALSGWRAASDARVRWVRTNDVADVHRVFDRIRASGEFPEVTVVEPVRGEGDPATPLDPSFYGALVARTRAAGGLVLVDSVQAGLRCHGVLSITDYPGFERQPRPDLETFAKALNGGVVSASLVAFGERARERFDPSLYGNTMAAHPRALAVMTACLAQMTPDVTRNVVARGRELRDALAAACGPDKVRGVRGVGLLVAILLRPGVAPHHVAHAFRVRGVHVVPARDSVRFTPWFRTSREEVRLMARVTREVLG